jgi:hypothetical protein
MTFRHARAPHPREAIGLTRKRFMSAKAVGAFLPALTTKAFRKYGFSMASLITDWPAIAGPELAHCTAPERLKWPRAVAPPDEDDATPSRQRTGATLILRVDGARALNVQYAARQIIERINAYLGYSAIAELRLVQAPVALPPQSRGATRRPAEPLVHEVAGIGDAKLRNALARLGAEVRAGR